MSVFFFLFGAILCTFFQSWYHENLTCEVNTGFEEEMVILYNCVSTETFNKYFMIQHLQQFADIVVKHNLSPHISYKIESVVKMTCDIEASNFIFQDEAFIEMFKELFEWFKNVATSKSGMCTYCALQQFDFFLNFKIL